MNSDSVEVFLTKNQVTQTLCDYLEPHLSQHGFKLVRYRSIFIKKTPFGSLELSVNTVSDWPKKQEVNFPVHISFHNINQVRKKFFKNVQKEDATMYKWLVLPNSNELKYKELYTEEDLEKAKIDAINLFDEQALPYFEQYSHLEEVMEYASKIRNSHFMSVLLIALQQTHDERYMEHRNQIVRYLKDHESSKTEKGQERKQTLFDLIKYLDQLNTTAKKRTEKTI